MASTGAVLYVRPRATASVSVNRSTGAVLYLTLRAASGNWTQTGVTATTDLTNLRAWLPPQRQPIGYVNGDKSQPVYMDAATWYKFLQYVAEIRLGGATGANVPDIATAIETTQTAASQTASTVGQVAQQGQTNAEALSAVVQVAVANALSGSRQIPPVKLSYADL